MKRIILFALVLLASIWPIAVWSQTNVTTKFQMKNILDGGKINAAVASLFVDRSGNIFAGTGTDYLYRSSDGGSTWVHLMNGLKGANMPFASAYAIEANSNGTLFLGTGGDLFNSTDNGNSWNSVQGLNSTGPLAISIKDSNMFVATGFGGSVYRSIDNGSDWLNVLNPPIGGFRAITFTPRGTIIAGTGNGDPQGWTSGIYRSTDNGDSGTWMEADSGLIGQIGNIGDGTLDSNGNMAANGYNIWGLSCDSSTGVVYAATDGEGIFRSNDDGQSWIQVNGSTPMPKYASAVLAANGKVWAIYHNDIGAGISGDAGLYYSADSGKTWQFVGLANTNGYCLYPYGGGRILAGTGSGIYIVSYTPSNPPEIASQMPSSMDSVGVNVPMTFSVAASSPNGDSLSYTWKVNGNVVSAGCDSLIYTFRELSSATTVSVVVSDASGASDSASWSFKIVTGVDEPSHGPATFTLLQNYPNPFNPTTTIEFSVSKPIFVHLSIFNILGQEVQVLVNGEKNPGSYSVQFNGSNLSSGVYFYRLQAGTFSQIKKMELLK